MINGTTIYSKLVFNGYKAGAIVGLVRSGCVATLDNITFEAGEGRKTYLSCPSNVNSVEIT